MALSCTTLILRKRWKKRIEEEIKTVYKEIPIEEKPYRILVPIANPAIAKKLVNFAKIIAKKRDGEIIVANIVRLPYQTPLTAALGEISKAKKMVSELLNQEVPVGGVVAVGHSVPEAILNLVDELKPNLIVMGWRGRTFRKDVVLGSTIDPVLVKAKCDVVVIKFGANSLSFERILIPTAGGPHAILACEIARDLARENSEIDLMYVGKSEKERNLAEKAFKEAEEILGKARVSKKFEIHSNPAERIAEEAEKHDVTIIGASEKPFLQNFLFGLFPEKIVRKTSKTVAMTRKWVRLIA